MCRCLYELGWYEEALSTINQFKLKFPEFASTNSCKSLEDEVLKAIKKVKSTSQSSTSPSSTRTNSSSSDQFPLSDSGPSGTPTSSQSSDSSRDRNFFLRFTSTTFSADSSNSESFQEEPEVEQVEFSGVFDGDSEDRSSHNGRTKQKKMPQFHDNEIQYQDKAFDYTERYCGHCNTTTDIKEANFFGESYIVAGSDDGSFFIWNRETTNIVKVIRGDESIVNCLQPHPSTCLLATSGIESVVRLWSPLPEVRRDFNSLSFYVEFMLLNF